MNQEPRTDLERTLQIENPLQLDPIFEPKFLKRDKEKRFGPNKDQENEGWISATVEVQ